MKINEMCGGGCDPTGPDMMPEPKTNYNLNITQDDGNTHKTMNVTSDAPDELMKVLSLAGVATGHSEPDGDEIVGVDLDGDEPAGPQSMGDLVQKLNSIGSDGDEAGGDEHDHDGMTHSHPHDGDHDHDHDHDDGDEYESVEQDPRSKPKFWKKSDLPMHGAGRKKQPSQRTVSARHGDNPYLDAGALEEQFAEAFVNTEIPNDDYKRALANLERAEKTFAYFEGSYVPPARRNSGQYACQKRMFKTKRVRK